MERPASHLRRVELPVHASRFIGRERLASELVTLVGKVRVVTLTGSPGCGKTRLAIEVASRAGRARADGAVLVELAALSEGGLLAETFAAALGVRHMLARPARDALLDRLRDWHGLIVVDNCEHLVEACAQLVDVIVRRCPSVTVLATSREPLRVDGEAVVPVPPLDLPPRDASFAAVGRSEAVRLFVERASQAQSRFQLTRSNAGQVASICLRLDGLPLALEIAAARVAAHDLETIHNQLDDRFRFLTGGFRSAPPRQRTLRAAIDWSYDLLTAAERQLLGRAAVFAGTFDLKAAEAVCAGGAVLREHVLELIGRLVDKSLVSPVQSSESQRYRLLDSIRAYALDRLRDSGEVDAIRRAQADHLGSLTDDGFEADPAWIPRIGAEIDNWREALSWSRNVDPELHLYLALPFGYYCDVAGSIAEGRGWLEPALSAAESDAHVLSCGYETAAYLAWRQDDFVAAMRLAREAVRLGRMQGDDSALARYLGAFAFISLSEPDLAESKRAAHEIMAIGRRLSSPLLEAHAFVYLGLAASVEQDLTAAGGFLQRSIELYAGAGHEYEAATSHNGLGLAYLQLGRPADARSEINRGLEIRARFQMLGDLGGSLDAAAELAYVEGFPRRAMCLNGAADALRESLGIRPPSLLVMSRSRWLPNAEKILGKEARFAWEQGRRMTPDEAVAYALGPASDRIGQGEVSPQRLSGRETEVARLVADGLSNDEIAVRLKLSRRTVEAHLDHIRTKLGARSRVDVATWMTARSTPQPASRS